MRATQPAVSGTSGRYWRMLAAGVFAAGLAMAWAPPLQSPEEQSSEVDGLSYYAIASHRQNEAYFYYAGRVLHPLAAGATAEAAGVPLPEGFRLISGLSLVVLFATVAFSVNEWGVIPLLLTALVVSAFRAYYLPDLFYAAELGLFFVAARAGLWWAVPILVLLSLSRESTMVLTMVMAVVAARRSRMLAASVVAIGLAGMLATHVLVSRGLPNKHGVSTAAFYVMKVSYNAAANLAGVLVWADTNSSVTPCDPIWTGSVHVGAIRRLSVCSRWQQPLETLVNLGSAFGVLPLLLWYRRACLPNRPDARVAFWYGLVSIALVPFIGIRTDRYSLYAWPLFWLCGGELLQSLPAGRREALVGLSVLASWIPAWLELWPALTAMAVLYGLARYVLVIPI